MPRPTDMTDRDYGSLERQEDGRSVLRFTRRLAHPPEQVWRALTEPAFLEGWFPTTIDGDLAAGAPLRFRHRDVDLPAMEGEMLAFEPPSLMELRWGDEDVLRFALAPDGEGGCVLEFTNVFDELGKGARDGAGWHACLDDLAHATAGEPSPGDPGAHWSALRDDYQARFGAEASTIGPPQEWQRVHGDGAS